MTDIKPHANFTPRAIEIIKEASAEALDEEITSSILQQLIFLTESNAAKFINYYKRSQFLLNEIVHTFTALEFFSNEDPNDKIEVQLAMVISPEGVLILAPNEVNGDEMYEVRRVIADAGMPEFYNDRA